MSEEKKKILFVTSEASPFAHTGGLGEVASALPKTLNARKQQDIDCRVILPLYGRIPQEVREQMEYLGVGSVSLGWRSQYMGVFSLEHDGVTYYFIDNEYYFKREGLYGYYDDCERFAYFSKAVFEALEIIDFVPDIIHANDWQAALVPVYQYAVYKRAFTKTIFTIHNVQYQGHYGMDVLGDIIDLPEDMGHLVEYGGDVNLMKGAIECADIVSTVSPTYAEELQDPAVAFGMDPIIRKNQDKLRGILNGIDNDSYNPSKDKAIAKNYSFRRPAGKAVCRTALQEELGLPLREDIPVMAMITRMVEAKGIDLVTECIDRILYDGKVQFVLLGTGEQQYEDFFRGLQSRHPESAVCMTEFDPAKSRRIYAGADMFLMPSRIEACGLAQMIACRYGAVPIVRQTGGLADSIQDCRLGDGNGFVFAGYTGEELEETVTEAAALFTDHENWNKLVEHNLKLNFGWKMAAWEYVDMYESLV